MTEIDDAIGMLHRRLKVRMAVLIRCWNAYNSANPDDGELCVSLLISLQNALSGVVLASHQLDLELTKRNVERRHEAREGRDVTRLLQGGVLDIQRGGEGGEADAPREESREGPDVPL